MPNKALLLKGMATLSEKEKIILQLFYLEDLSFDEISAVLSIPVCDIGIALSTAKTKMRSFTDVFDRIDTSGSKGLQIYGR